MSDFPRITRDPAVMGGRACIRGQRVTVGMIVGNLGACETIDDLLRLYPYLEREDILEAIRYDGRTRLRSLPSASSPTDES
jgi:uncharacterized protein (DUF433 family)